MGASRAMQGSLSQAPGVMLCDFPFSLWKPLEAKPTYSSMWGHAFFLIHCHSLGERTNKDDFWQPEKIGLQLSEIFPKKMRKKEGQPTQSALSHLAFSHTFTESGPDASSFTAFASRERELLLTLASENGLKKGRWEGEEEWSEGVERGQKWHK